MERITATQAYKNTQFALKENEIEPTLEYIFEEVRIASKSGAYSVDVTINLNTNRTNRVVNRLTELAFIVTPVAGDTYNISWAHIGGN